MEMKLVRLTVGKRLVAIWLLTIMLVALPVVIWIIVDRNWRNLEQRVESRKLEALTLDRTRVPVPGAVVPGNAWDDYMQAIRTIAGTPSKDLAPLFQAIKEVKDPQAIDAFLASHAGTLEVLRTG